MCHPLPDRSVPNIFCMNPMNPERVLLRVNVPKDLGMKSRIPCLEVSNAQSPFLFRFAYIISCIFTILLPPMESTSNPNELLNNCRLPSGKPKTCSKVSLGTLIEPAINMLDLSRLIPSPDHSENSSMVFARICIEIKSPLPNRNWSSAKVR